MGSLSLYQFAFIKRFALHLGLAGRAGRDGGGAWGWVRDTWHEATANANI